MMQASVALLRSSPSAPVVAGAYAVGTAVPETRRRLLMDQDWNDGQPIYRQLQDRVVAMILDGSLARAIRCRRCAPWRPRRA